MKKTLNILIISFVIIFNVFFFFQIYLGIFFPIKYKKEIAFASAYANVDASLICSVANVESKFNASAVSSAGAVGIMQILPSTAKYVCDLNNLIFNENDLVNAEKNILIGSLYIKYLQSKFEDNDAVLCAYNAGEGTVRTWLSSSYLSKNEKTLINIPYKETREYVEKVNKNLKIYKTRF